MDYERWCLQSQPPSAFLFSFVSTVCALFLFISIILYAIQLFFLLLYAIMDVICTFTYIRSLTMTDYIRHNLFDKFEFHNYGHALIKSHLTKPLFPKNLMMFFTPVAGVRSESPAIFWLRCIHAENPAVGFPVILLMKKSLRDILTDII